MPITSTSEHYLHAELNHAARLAGLDDRLSTRRCNSRATRLAEYCRSNGRRAYRGAHRSVKVRMIERVECFSTELHFHLLGHVKYLGEPEIEIPVAGTDERISTDAISTGGRELKRARVGEQYWPSHAGCGFQICARWRTNQISA